MSAIICFQHASGNMAVLVPMLNRVKGETTEERKARYDVIDLDALAEKDIPDGIPFEICDSLDLPKGREFRGAWINHPTKPGLKVDIPKARDIHMDRIRKARDKKLAESDVAITRAMEDENQPEIAKLRAERTVLRDIPATFDLSGATTPAELPVLGPNELER